MSTPFAAPGYRPDDTDPDLAGLDSAGIDDAPSDLDDLAAELNAAIVPTVAIPVEGRPGYVVRYRSDFTGKDLERLRKRCKDRQYVDGFDGIKFAALLLAFACQGITRNGEELSERLGEAQPVTFTSRALQELMGTADAQGTVRRFYGLEGHIDAAARRLMREAGWGDEADVADPSDPTE